ncbi:uncharacterized protein isoform X2 [Rhodnius prolixus]|uniref:uncharacterized protein isoform X2 n=1 Tax=Rhodnius prolixus TaxID=13249 RepID=UPI003D18C728
MDKLNCSDCRIAFSSKSQFEIHRALTHQERRKYSCTCGKDFLYKKNLNQHQKKCTARGSYRCSKCESIFSDIHNGQLHEAVCQLALQSEDKMLEPQRNQLLSLKQSDDNVTPYETSFKGRLASYFIRSPCCMDLSMFLKDVRSKIKDIIQKMVAMHSSIKVNLWVDCTFKNMLGEKMTKALKTSNQAIYKATDINEYLAEVFAKLRREMEDAVMSKSGWTLISVDGLRVRIEIGFWTVDTTQDIISPDEAQENSVIIFDDISMDEQENIRKYFSMGRHRHIDCFYLCQSYARIPKHLIRDNANIIILFKQDDLNLKHVYKDHVSSPNISFDKFKQMCNVCWEKPFGFITIDKTRDLNNGKYRMGLDTFIYI